MLCHNCSPMKSSSLTKPNKPPWSLGTALGVWVVSVLLSLMLPGVAMIVYLLVFDQPLLKEALRGGASPPLTAPVILFSLGSTFIAHLVILAISWQVVTGGGQRPFRATLGWGWHTQFKWIHAIGLALFMLLLGKLFEKVLPHGETDFEQLLRLGLAVRVGVAILAVLTAPIVEEVVYRGILYTALESRAGDVTSIVVVALLFGVVHMPQYQGSWAAIAAVLALSLVLTLLRAATGKLLPCVATHFVFNGIQAVALLVQPPQTPQAGPAAAVILAFQSWPW